MAHALRAIIESSYTTTGVLGSGLYGIIERVERVDRPGMVYARKAVRIRGPNSASAVQIVENEIRTLRRLRHRHLIGILEHYTHRNELFMLLDQVADTDLGAYLKIADATREKVPRDELKLPMVVWPGCLIQAIDYLHEMRVVHKDITPSNILIQDSRVLIADFGISKDLLDIETAAILRSNVAQETSMYVAPEATVNSHRGYAGDMFSLGCIFLEIGTVLFAGPGFLSRLSDFREINGRGAYSACPMKLVEWMYHVLDRFHRKLSTPIQESQRDNIKYGICIHELAFLMLDSDPEKRITSRQLVSMLHAQELQYHTYIKDCACVHCKKGLATVQPNLPLHSVFTGTSTDLFFEDPEAAAKTQLATNWEEVKQLWLERHMWWDPQE